MPCRQTSHCDPNWRQQASRRTGLAAFQMRFPLAARPARQHASWETRGHIKMKGKHFHAARCLTWRGEAVLGFLPRLRRLFLALGLISAATGGWRRAMRRERGVDTLGGRVAPLQQQAHALGQERWLYLCSTFQTQGGSTVLHLMESPNILKTFFKNKQENKVFKDKM